MKTFSFLAIVMAFSFFSSANAATVLAVTTDTVMVWGNCDMCKARIEKAAKSAGATTAVWDVDTHVLAVGYTKGKTDISAIEKKVAAVGHDTQNVTAPSKAYEALPGCCKYERKTVPEKSASLLKAKCTDQACANNCNNMGRCTKAASTLCTDASCYVNSK